jgi:hypothetical protein
MCCALCQAGYQSFVFRIVETIPLVQRGQFYTWQASAMFSWLLPILFAVACCGRISSPIILRLCSELLAHELLFVMNYKKGLIVCFLLAC